MKKKCEMKYLHNFRYWYGVPGIFVSCLFSGALSTLDSALHALAGVTWEEVKGLSWFKNTSEARATYITKALSIFFGLVATGLAFLCSNMGSLISAGGTLFGAVMGPMFAYTIASTTLPFVNLKGSTAGFVIGQAVNIWLVFASVAYRPPYKSLPLHTDDCSMFGIEVTSSNNVTSSTSDEFLSGDFTDLYKMSFHVYPILGLLLTFILMILISLVTGGGKDLTEDDEKYFYPPAWKMYRSFRKGNMIKRRNQVNHVI